MWTDKVQAWAGIAAIISALIGFVILFIKDHNKEKQIQKLSDIADNLNKIAADSERRYRISKKPHIEIKGQYLEEGFIGLIFTNSNPATSIADFLALDSTNEGNVGIPRQVQDSNGKQKLYLNIPVEEVPVGIKFTMKYFTTEGFLYLQYLTVLLDEEYKVGLSKSPISHEDEEY